MALRLVNKINRQIVKNVCRSLSAKREIAEVELKAVEAAKSPEPVAPVAADELPQTARPRNLPAIRSLRDAKNETDVHRQYVAMQHLQPALLPEYYKPPVEIHSCMYPDPVTEPQRIGNQNRKFEDSKTCMNVTLPLKGPKLASPFPDPVKTMYSHTVSDQEKADQMLADAKLSKQTSKRHIHTAIRFVSQSRFYSTKKKCPGLKPPAANKCRSFKVAPCQPAKDLSCRKMKERLKCTKKEAPYPSYSESCHEDPYQKPSECKMCPWKPDEHPTFTPPKQNFHTSTILDRAMRKGDCKKPDRPDRKPCGWMEEEKKERERQNPKKNTQPPKKGCVGLSSTEIEGVELAGKAPCQRPDNNNCKKDKKDKKQEANQKGRNQPKKSAAALSLSMDTWMRKLKTQVDPFKAGTGGIDITDVINFSGEKRSKFRKFPFQKCDFDFERKPKEPSLPPGQCPKKKLPKFVQDCPAKKCADAAHGSDVGEQQVVKPPYTGELGYFMADDKKTKCPKFKVNFPEDFPFQKCDFDFERKPKEPTLPPGQCPKKKLPKFVQDCPPKKCTKAAHGSDVGEQQVVKPPYAGELGYFMADKKPKCPKVNLNVVKDPNEDPDPCNRRRKGQTYKCPENLIAQIQKGKKRPPRQSAPLPRPSIPSPIPMPVQKSDNRVDF